MDPMDTIFVKQVKSDGPANMAGLQKGDRILSVNGESVSGKTYSQVIALIQASDKSLQLIVVPKNEDILQVAYQSSAYNQVKETYRGSASEIPDPPDINFTPPKGLDTKPPLPHRFKSEISLTPEDSRIHRRPSDTNRPTFDATQDPHQCQRMSVSSLNSLSSGGSSGGHVDPRKIPLGDRHRYQRVDDSTNGGPDVGGYYGYSSPLVGKAAQYPNMDSRCVSMDSVSSDGSRHSQNASQRTYKMKDDGGSSDRVAQINIRMRSPRSSSQDRNSSHAQRRSRENLKRCSDQVDDHISGPHIAAPSHIMTSSPGPAHFSPNTCTAATYRAQPYTRSHTTSALTNQNIVTTTAGITIASSQAPPRTCMSARYLTPQAEPVDHRKPPIWEMKITTSPSLNHKSRSHGCDLERVGAPGSRVPNPNDSYGLAVSYRLNDRTGSPASREQNISSGSGFERTLSNSNTYANTRYSVPEKQMINLVSERMKKFESAESVLDIGTKSTKAHTIQITAAPQKENKAPSKFGCDSVASKTAKYEQRISELSSDDEAPQSPRWRKASVDSAPPITGLSAASSNSSLQQPPPDLQRLSPRETIKFYFRTDNPPQSMKMERSPERMLGTPPQQPPAPGDRDRSPLTCEGKGEGSSHRRTPRRQPSYLSAINSPQNQYNNFDEDRNNVCMRPNLDTTDSAADKDDKKVVRRRSYLAATQQITIDKSQTDPNLEPPPSSPQPTTPTKTSIGKLKAFFGEKKSTETPRILEATTDRKSLFDIPSPVGEVIKEGTLVCKVAVTDGKRASNRSWKPLWAVLRGHALYLFKDRASASVSQTLCEEQPISVKSCIVDIAYDYTKKKNVFRLTTYNGSEYLFQSDDNLTMLAWIKVIQSNSDPDKDSEGIATEELVKRTIREHSHIETATGKTSPQVTAKVKKTSTRSLRSKSPASFSPAQRQKKQTSKDDLSETGKKDNRSWKKMAKKFKRHTSSSSAVETSDVDVNGTFEVPLDMCPPSDIFEFVPRVVELCTGIIEERGLEHQGIYRVSGNVGAVNMLTDELNKDPYNVDLNRDQWKDVNVVSNVLKAFLRKLPECLITDDLYEPLIRANRAPDPEKRMLKMKKLLHDLPDHNKETLRFLAEHFSKIAENGDVNKMDTRNLAIVLGPTLVWKSNDSMMTMVADMIDKCRIVESILSHWRWFFSSWDEDVYVPVDSPQEGTAPISGMNQELLTTAENLELGDRGRDVSAKDLMQNLIIAANKKRKKDKTKEEVESEPVHYNERNIDAEIEIRSKQVITSESTSTTNTSVIETSRNSETSQVAVSSSSNTTIMSIGESHNVSGKSDMYTAKRVYVKHADSQSSIVSSSTSATDDSANNRLPSNANNRPPAIVGKTPADDVKVTRKPAYPEIQQSTPLSTENSKPMALVFTANEGPTNRSPNYNTAPYRSKIDLQQMQQKEQERIRKLTKQKEEFLLQHPPPSSSSNFMSYARFQSTKPDTVSLTSDYSTTSSTTNSYSTDKRRGSNTQEYSTGGGNYTSSASQQMAPNRGIPRGMLPPEYTPYSERNTRSSSSLISQQYQSKHSIQEEPIINNKHTGLRRDGNISLPTHVAEDKSLDTSDYGTADSRPSHLEFGRRRGSLDSLLDTYDKSETTSKDVSYVESEDEPLMESITSTFDRKLKLIKDPKTGNVHPTSRAHNSEEHLRSHQVVPHNVDLSSYKDPSLHRSPSREPELGGPTHSSTPKCTGDTLDGTITPKSQNVSSLLMSKDSMTESFRAYADVIRNTTEKFYDRDRKLDASSKLFGSTECLLKIGAGQNSPPISTPSNKKSNKKIKRRHTVGGTQDVEHFKALMQVFQDRAKDKPSAVARLNTVKVSPKHEQKPVSIHQWICQQQKLRHAKSSPSLLEPALQMKPYVFYQHEKTYSPSDQRRRRHEGQGPVSPSAPVNVPRKQSAPSFNYESSL